MAIPEEIWVEEMHEKSSKITDFACLGRSTNRFERNLVEFAGFCKRNQIPSSKKRFPGYKIILKEFAGKFGTQFFHIAIKIEAPIYIYIYIYIYTNT